MNLFDHEGVDDRVADIALYAGDLINGGLLEGLAQPVYESCTSDDFEWLGDNGKETANQFFHRFKSHYTHFYVAPNQNLAMSSIT